MITASSCGDNWETDNNSWKEKHQVALQAPLCKLKTSSALVSVLLSCVVVVYSPDASFSVKSIRWLCRSTLNVRIVLTMGYSIFCLKAVSSSSMGILASKSLFLGHSSFCDPGSLKISNYLTVFMTDKHSLELQSSAADDDGHLQRTGTLWSCIAHIITAVVGAGVLSLAWSTAQLGWIAGPVLLLCFAIITYVSAFLQADCYRCHEPITGKRNHTYMDAVDAYLGKKRMLACGLLQHVSLYGTSIAYVITCATSISAIRKSNCYHEEGRHGPCHFDNRNYMLFFGGVQIIMSFIPDFHNMTWVSVMAAIMSFAYSFIGLGLGFAKVLGNGRVKGGITGAPATNIQKKLWNSFEALGDISFSYPYSRILLEIQDTLKSPPAENKTMKDASMISVLLTTFLYFGCGCFGYAAFGDETPGNLLTGFGFFEPYWLVDLANACIVLHLIGGYQVYSQPIFATSERWISKKFPNSRFVNSFHSIKFPFLPALRTNLMKLILRTAYVMSTTGIALLFPYFNSVLGVLGALNFWPLAIYFPVEMYIVQKKITAWTRTWVVLQSFSLICFAITVLGFLGSFEDLISSKFS